MPTTSPISANSSAPTSRRREISSDTLARYLADMLGRRKLAAASVRRRFACLRAFFRQRAEREGFADPLAGPTR